MLFFVLGGQSIRADVRIGFLHHLAEMLKSKSSVLARMVSGRCVRARSTVTAEEVKEIPDRLPGQMDDTKLKDYTEIPGPKALPIFGTLYKYLPYFGELILLIQCWINGVVRFEFVVGVRKFWCILDIFFNLFRYIMHRRNSC